MRKHKTVFRIFDRATGHPVGSYSRAYHDKFEFVSEEDARAANCHGMFNDKEKYKVAKYRVVYHLISED